jgi:hypothetical protein
MTKPEPVRVTFSHASPFPKMRLANRYVSTEYADKNTCAFCRDGVCRQEVEEYEYLHGGKAGLLVLHRRRPD